VASPSELGYADPTRAQQLDITWISNGFAGWGLKRWKKCGVILLMVSFSSVGRYFRKQGA
jgi:hypothetical protein